MGTGSEPRQTSNPWKSLAGSVPVPFFHGKPELGNESRSF